KLEADPDLRFPNLMKEHPLPPHPTQGYDADRPDWKPEQ
ncbi:sel1 repeat family protein, partial [Pseudomonas aeruginosa]